MLASLFIFNSKMHYKKFTLRLVVFLLVIYSLDLMIGSVLEFLFFKQKTGPNYQIIESITTNRADLVVLGNSRAQHHYNPRIISKKTGFSSVNAGLNGGYGVYLPTFQVDEISNNYKPKAIIVEIDPNALGFWKGNFDRLTVLLPFIDRYPNAIDYILLRDNYQKVKLYSKSYRYNSLIYNELMYSLFANKFNHVKSFIPISKKLSSKDSIASVNKIRNMSSPTMDINMELILKKLINIAKYKNIKLIFVNSPIYNNTLNDNYSIAGKKAIQIMNDNKISFWDYSNDTSFFNKYYLFSDRLHLNNKGAELYSNIIAERLVAEGISIKK
jgi:hypothetical protein